MVDQGHVPGRDPARFGFSPGAVRDWEQGRKPPEGTARTLLLLIEENPQMAAAAAVRVA